MLEKLVLFDIDGTLLTIGGAARRAISRALKEVYQIVDSLENLSRSAFAGKTDPEIILSILEKNHYRNSSRHDKLPSFYRCYTEALKEELPGESRARLFPGVRELLQKLKSSNRAVLGLLTGNIREGALIKLSHFGLESFFTHGSYGSDSGNRSDLPAFAVQRVKEDTGKEYRGKDVVIIGDTLSDLMVSQENGARSVLVATGFFPYEELAQAGPDHLFRDFSNTSEVVKVILA